MELGVKVKANLGARDQEIITFRIQRKGEHKYKNVGLQKSRL